MEPTLLYRECELNMDGPRAHAIFAVFVVGFWSLCFLPGNTLPAQTIARCEKSGCNETRGELL